MNNQIHKILKNPLNKNKYRNNIIPKCNRCENYGHLSLDCLINPIINDDVNLFCSFCGSDKHIICPMNNPPFLICDYDSDDVEIEDNISNEINEENLQFINNYKVNTDNFYSILNYFKNEKKKLILKNRYEKEKKKINLNKVFSDINNGDIYKIIFCYKCGGRHLSNICNGKINEKKNENKIQDYNYLKQSNKEGNYDIKNSYKYEPILSNEEYTINKNIQNNTYYNNIDRKDELDEKK